MIQFKCWILIPSIDIQMLEILVKTEEWYIISDEYLRSRYFQAVTPLHFIQTFSFDISVSFEPNFLKPTLFPFDYSLTSVIRPCRDHNLSR